MRRIPFLLFLVPFAAGPALGQEPAPVDSLALARQYTLWLYDGQGDSLVAHSSQDARNGFSTAEAWRDRSSQIAEALGFEVGVHEETWKRRNGRCEYWRTVSFSNIVEWVLIRWRLNALGEIVGANIGPAAMAPSVESETCEG